MYNKHILNNGIRVVTKKIPHVRSVSIGFWINTGSTAENLYTNGTSHFIEHMLFKGTYNRSAKNIAATIDEIGGQLNAFTSKECTCYYAKILDSHISIGIDILSDMLFNSKFDTEDIKKEKGVVCEEINMYEDSPEDVVYDLLSKTIFKNHPLGLPILGTHSTIENLDRDSLISYIKRNYTSENIVISVAGSFNEEYLTKELNEKVGSFSLPKNKNNIASKPAFLSDFSYKSKDIEQIHLCIGFQGLPYNEDEIYPLLVMNNILGGSMSSRLFQTVREDNGLAYSIYSHPSFYKSTGLFTIYTSLNPSQMDKAFSLIIQEIQNLINEPISQSELSKSKEQLKGNYILGLESTSSIMTMLGKSELINERIKTPDEVLAKINKVTIEDTYNVVKNTFDNNKISMSVVGKSDEKTIENKYRLIQNSI